VSTYFIHAANILYLLSYLVRDILWLRVLTVVAGSTLLPYYYLQRPPLYAAIAWNALFLSINAFHIQRLLLERRPVRLNPTELELHELLFPSLTSREFKQLVDVGSWQNVDAARMIVEQGAVLDALRLIARGRLDVRVDGEAVASLESGRLVGEMSYLTGEKTSASVWACEPSLILEWPCKALESFLRDHPQQRLAVQRLIGTDLVAKLRGRPPPTFRPIDRNEPRSSSVSSVESEPREAAKA
jgi:CRP-like cAMP-binding protein